MNLKPLTVIILFFSGFVLKAQDTVKITESLQLIPLNEYTWIHSSLMTQEPYGTFTCNGLLYIRGKEAIIADTPADLESSELLLQWLESQGIQTKAVIVNHFHDDCLIGLPAFHTREIASYGHYLTPGLAQAQDLAAPQHTFEDSLVLILGNTPVIAAFVGEAHTKDNVVVYLPNENVLFGGCMVKSLRSGKGYLGAANLDTWSHTIEAVKGRFRPLFVVPGHGSHGGPELLDYTIEMFKEYQK